MENIQLKCGEYFHLISDARGEDDQQINYSQPYLQWVDENIFFGKICILLFQVM